MQCTQCKAKLEESDIRAYLIADTVTELHAKCSCGAVFSAWVNHEGWALGEEPVDLSDTKAAPARGKKGRS